MRLLPLLTAEETRRAEEAHPGSLDELMERAGTAVAELVLRSFPGRVTVVAGKGKNGGDAKVCARALGDAGRDVTLVEGSGDLGTPDVVVDGLLGIGLQGAPREDAARMIDLINASGRPVVSIDVPSGVNASTGEISGAAVRATVTVTFGAAKVGLAVAPGRLHAGAVTVAPLGLRPREHEHALVPASVLLDVPAKQVDSTKYSAGSVLVVGGSRGLTGAVMLASLAAYRADAGYVAVAAPESALPVLESALLEVVKHPLPEDTSGRLLPRSADAVRRAASRFGSVVLLKGADTLVASPREGVLVASYGSPALATAGSGDVLTGIVAAFIAKGIEAQLAAAAAAVAHGVASELLDPPRGAVASDLLPGLRLALAGHGLQRAPLAGH